MRAYLLYALAFASALSPAADFAQIYVYARRDTPARSWLPISCGSTIISELRQGTFFAARVESGHYTFEARNGVPTSIDIRSGEEYFLRLDWDHGIDRGPIPLFSKIPAAQARMEMKYLTYVPVKKLHSSLAERSDPTAPNEPTLHTRDDR